MALCTNCNTELFGGKVCYSCGARVGDAISSNLPTSHPEPPNQQNIQQPQQYQQQPQQYQQQQYQPQFQPMQRSSTNGLAIASLICAFFFFPLGIIFGHVALSQIKKNNQGGSGLATAGLIISYLALLFVLFAF